MAGSNLAERVASRTPSRGLLALLTFRPRAAPARRADAARRLRLLGCCDAVWDRRPALCATLSCGALCDISGHRWLRVVGGRWLRRPTRGA